MPVFGHPSSSPTTILTLTNKESFVGQRIRKRPQGKATNQLGQVRVYNLAPAYFEIPLNLALLTDQQREDLFAFMDTANWSKDAIRFTDDRGNLYLKMHFWGDRFLINRTSRSLHKGRILLRQSN